MFQKELNTVSYFTKWLHDSQVQLPCYFESTSNESTRPAVFFKQRLALNGIKKTQMSYTVYLLAPSLSENHSRDGVLRQTLVFHNAPTTSIP